MNTCVVANTGSIPLLVGY